MGMIPSLQFSVLPCFFSERSERAKMIAGFWSTIASNWISEYLVSSLGCCSPHFRGGELIRPTYQMIESDLLIPWGHLKIWRVTFPSLFSMAQRMARDLAFCSFIVGQSLYDSLARLLGDPFRWLTPNGYKLWEHMATKLWEQVPSRELTYPTWGKGKSSSKVPFYGIC